MQMYLLVTKKFNAKWTLSLSNLREEQKKSIK